MLNTSFKKNSKFCPYYYVKVYIIFLENCHLKYKILFYLALGFFLLFVFINNNRCFDLYSIPTIKSERC